MASDPRGNPKPLTQQPVRTTGGLQVRISAPPGEVRPPPPEDDEGELIGAVVADRYRVLKKLGEGGMGTVYLAEHITIEKKVALKVLLHDYARKADLKERFLQEARAAARIGHENIVDITDFGETPDHSVFFAMEFLEGIDLAQLIRREGPIAWRRAKPIVLQICRALGAAHSKGIVHRDMKPENIYLIEREGRSDFVKVLDFGIAKMSVDDRESRLTRTGMIFGTPEYMSPEQAQGNKPDHRVDIYAVAVIMYEMLTGRVPFKADTFMGILTKHIFEQPLPPSQMNPDAVIPLDAEQIVIKALSKERGERYQSMAEMAAAITSAAGRMTRPTGDQNTIDPRIVTASRPLPLIDDSPAPSSATAEIGDFRPPRRWGAVIAALFLLLAGLSTLAFLLLSRKTDPESDPGRSAGSAAPTAGTGQATLTRPDAAPPAPVPPATHEVRISTSPAGAAVYRGDQRLGVTPYLHREPRSNTRLELILKLAGYRPEVLTITPSGGQFEESVTLTREQARPLPRKGLRPPPEPRRVEPKQPEPKKPEPKIPTPPPKKKKQSGDLMDPFD